MKIVEPEEAIVDFINGQEEDKYGWSCHFYRTDKGLYDFIIKNRKKEIQLVVQDPLSGNMFSTADIEELSRMNINGAGLIAETDSYREPKIPFGYRIVTDSIQKKIDRYNTMAENGSPKTYIWYVLYDINKALEREPVHNLFELFEGEHFLVWPRHFKQRDLTQKQKEREQILEREAEKNFFRERYWVL